MLEKQLDNRRTVDRNYFPIQFPIYYLLFIVLMGSFPQFAVAEEPLFFVIVHDSQDDWKVNANIAGVRYALGSTNPSIEIVDVDVRQLNAEGVKLARQTVSEKAPSNAKLAGLMFAGHGNEGKFFLPSGEAYSGSQLAEFVTSAFDERLSPEQTATIYIGSCLGAVKCEGSPGLQDSFVETVVQHWKEKKWPLRMKVLAHTQATNAHLAHFPGIPFTKFGGKALDHLERSTRPYTSAIPTLIGFAFGLVLASQVPSTHDAAQALILLGSSALGGVTTIGSSRRVRVVEVSSDGTAEVRHDDIQAVLKTRIGSCEQSLSQLK